MKIVITAFLIALLFVGCRGKVYNAAVGGDINDTIFVTYNPYIYETSTATPCSSIAEYAKSGSTELMVKEISTKDFSLIADFVNQMKSTVQERGCEARVHVKMGNIEFCLSDFICCACDIDDNYLNTSSFEYAIYKIKHLSGYYNCYDSLDIKYDELVCKFGIPEDYCYDSKPFFIVLDTDEKGEIYDYNVEDVRRVALVRKSNRISGAGSK